MKTIARILCAAFVTAGSLTVPSVAQAAADAPLFAALVERTDDGDAVTYPIHAGETLPVVLGVTNVGTAPSAGVVVNIRTRNDLNLPTRFNNCRYYENGDLDGAWCEFGRELPVGGTYALNEFAVEAEEDAEEVASVDFEWFTKAWADKQGGTLALAMRDAAEPVVITGDVEGFALVPRELPVPAGATSPAGSANLELAVGAPPTEDPTEQPTTPPTSPEPGTSSSATAPPAPGSGGGGTGGLPLTGSNTALIGGAGGLLLLIGGIIVLALRRRTRFAA